MATCKNCGRQLPGNANICFYCGTPLKNKDDHVDYYEDDHEDDHVDYYKDNHEEDYTELLKTSPDKTEKEKGKLLYLILIVLFVVLCVVAVNLVRQWVPPIQKKIDELELGVETDDGKFVISQTNGTEVLRTSDFTCTGYLMDYYGFSDYCMVFENTSDQYIDIKGKAVYYFDKNKRGKDEFWGSCIAPGGKRLVELYPEKETNRAELTFELEYIDMPYIYDEYVGYEVVSEDVQQIDIKFLNNRDESVYVYLSVLFFEDGELVYIGNDYQELGESGSSNSEQLLSVFCDASYDSYEVLYEAF